MDGSIIQAIAVGIGASLPAIGCGIAVVYKVGSFGEKVDGLGKRVDGLTKSNKECITKIATIEGYINGRKAKE